jgi:hypothetical protein
MSNRLLRILMFGLLCLSLSAFAACGDDPEPEGNNGNNGNNGVECTTNDECTGDDEICVDDQCVVDAPACSEDGDCSSTEICTEAGECLDGCRDADDCSGDLVCLDDNSCGCETEAECASGEVCQSGACESVASQCQAAGDSCDSESAVPAGDGFTCLNDGDSAQCYTLCEEVPEGEPSQCTSGSFCNVGTGSTTGYCYTSECSSIGDDAGCDDEVAARPDQYPEGAATCVAFRNNTFVCQASGTISMGDACGTGVTGSCEQGLVCGFDATCVSYCTDDTACEDEETCIGEDTGEFTRQSGWGICGDGCESYGADGQCGQDMGCFPLTPEDGICQDTGANTAYTACDVPDLFCDQTSDCPTSGDYSCNSARGVCEQSCTATSECTDSEICEVPDGETDGTCTIPPQCEEGSRCVNLGDSNGRCMPVCDPTADDQAASDATCGTGNPTAYTRFLHLAQGADAVDIYVDDALVEDDFGTDAGTTGAITRALTATDTGDVTIDVVANDAVDNMTPLASLQTTLLLNDQRTIAIVNVPDGSGGTMLDIVALDVARDIAAPASGQAKMNLALDADLGTNVDVYVLGDADPFTGTETPVFTDVAFGEATDFSADMAPGDYAVYLFEEGATPLAAATNALATLDVTLAADDLLTFHVWGTDPYSATAVEYSQGAETANNGYCFDLSSGEAAVNSGACFERCTGPEAYGQGLCSESADVCAPFRSNHVCLPSSGATVGDSCDPGSLTGCEAGSFCRSLGEANADGSATGICAKRCVPGGSSNQTLGCPTEQACQPIGDDSFDFGQCGFACAPTDVPSDFSSSDCTEDFLMSCPPAAAGDQAFCAASNDVAVGDSCGEVSANNCVPNAICRRGANTGTYIDVLLDPVQGMTGPNNDGGACRRRCELFTDGASGCPSGQECWVDGATLSAESGYCVDAEPALSDIGALEACPAEHLGKMCGDASICSGFGDGSTGCFQWCDTASGAENTCDAGMSCQQLNDTADLPVGLCLPN